MDHTLKTTQSTVSFFEAINNNDNIKEFSQQIEQKFKRWIQHQELYTGIQSNTQLSRLDQWNLYKNSNMFFKKLSESQKNETNQRIQNEFKKDPNLSDNNIIELIKCEGMTFN